MTSDPTLYPCASVLKPSEPWFIHLKMVAQSSSQLRAVAAVRTKGGNSLETRRFCMSGPDDCNRT